MCRYVCGHVHGHAYRYTSADMYADMGAGMCIDMCADMSKGCHERLSCSTGSPYMTFHFCMSCDMPATVAVLGSCRCMSTHRLSAQHDMIRSTIHAARALHDHPAPSSGAPNPAAPHDRPACTRACVRAFLHVCVRRPTHRLSTQHDLSCDTRGEQPAASEIKSFCQPPHIYARTCLRL